jgi:single-strand selective monofunctional uracil DNA glycosylase
VGGFAKKRAEEVFENREIKIATILHPSPASPAANRGWAEAANKQLKDQGIWQ